MESEGAVPAAGCVIGKAGSKCYIFTTREDVGMQLSGESFLVMQLSGVYCDTWAVLLWCFSGVLSSHHTKERRGSLRRTSLEKAIADTGL